MAKTKTEACSTGSHGRGLGHGNGAIVPEWPSWPPPTSPGAVKVTGMQQAHEATQRLKAVHGAYGKLWDEKERLAQAQVKAEARERELAQKLLGYEKTPMRRFVQWVRGIFGWNAGRRQGGQA